MNYNENWMKKENEQEETEILGGRTESLHTNTTAKIGPLHKGSRILPVAYSKFHVRCSATQTRAHFYCGVWFSEPRQNGLPMPPAERATMLTNY
ncbi:MAG: hypothetical protein P4L03_01685 [Terracidiphilus sp.]|nr:hypothetical protein [Terracidiphilus sp.]